MNRFLLLMALAVLNLPVAGQSPLDAKYLAGMKWRNVGPLRGGRSLGATGSPGRPLEYYFGATGGGLWKTTDGGQNWSELAGLRTHPSSAAWMPGAGGMERMSWS